MPLKCKSFSKIKLLYITKSFDTVTFDAFIILFTIKSLLTIIFLLIKLLLTVIFVLHVILSTSTLLLSSNCKFPCKKILFEVNCILFDVSITKSLFTPILLIFSA